jgi:phosphonoacetaldehyde hydrolase
MNTHARISAIMLDWAGTTVDHGSIAPVLALQTLFAKHDIQVSSEDARREMGLLKRDHIHAILKLENVRAAWVRKYGSEPTIEDLDALYAEFGPLQMEIITKHSQVIDGVTETVARWRSQGIRIGTTTGYTRAMLDPVIAQARTQGYSPDASVCPDEVGAGRPAPWMLLRNAQLLDVYPLSRCVKIGDTISDIEEGRNAGMWTIGLSRTGNMIGLDAATFAALPLLQKQHLVAQAGEAFRRSGAAYIAEDLPSCEPILSEIEDLLRRGITPSS